MFVRTIVSACVIACSAVSSGVAQEQETKRFLPDRAGTLMKGAKTVRATCLERMKYVPAIVSPGDPHFSKTLSEAQMDTVIKALELSQEFDLDKRLSDCKFDPGLSLTFSRSNGSAPVDREDDVFTVLLCLNCDVWAMGEIGMDSFLASDRVRAFGDAKPDRKELEAIYKSVCAEKPEGNAAPEASSGE